MKPNFPIYIVSKGRWEKRLTANSLDKMGIPYFMVIEQSQFEQYNNGKSKFCTLLILDPDYQKNYDTFDNLGLTKSVGPGAARNFAWDHSIKNGHSWHWVMDDNINYFFRYNNNLKVICHSSAIFSAMEDFVTRYENVAMAGPNYFMFVEQRGKMPPYVMNTRIYSCNLIRNDVPFRWRGRYNEDTDLSLRMLKSNWCTVQFNAFLQQKITTQSIGGGNTAEFYSKEGTYPKSKMLEDMHPDLSKVVWKFNRWHHHVDYTVFKGMKLKRKPNKTIPETPNNFGMYLQKDDPEDPFVG